MAAQTAAAVSSAKTCEGCGASDAVEYGESLFSPKFEGFFCSDRCAREHQLQRLGRLLGHREASR